MAKRNSQSVVVTTISISDLAWASISGMELISRLVGDELCRHPELWQRRPSSNGGCQNAFVSMSALGGRGGKSLQGKPDEVSSRSVLSSTASPEDMSMTSTYRRVMSMKFQFVDILSSEQFDPCPCRLAAAGWQQAYDARPILVWPAKQLAR